MHESQHRCSRNGRPAGGVRTYARKPSEQNAASQVGVNVDVNRARPPTPRLRIVITRDRRGALSRTRNTRPEPRHETHTPPALSSQASFPISALVPRGSGCQLPEASCHDCPLASSALPIRQAGLQEARLSAWTKIPRSRPTTKAASSSSALVLRYHALTSSTADAPS